MELFLTFKPSTFAKLNSLKQNCLNIYIYILVLFGLVKPELGVIPTGQKPFNSKHLNFPGKELNVTDITEQ